MLCLLFYVWLHSLHYQNIFQRLCVLIVLFRALWVCSGCCDLSITHHRALFTSRLVKSLWYLRECRINESVMFPHVMADVFSVSHWVAAWFSGPFDFKMFCSNIPLWHRDAQCFPFLLSATLSCDSDSLKEQPTKGRSSSVHLLVLTHSDWTPRPRKMNQLGAGASVQLAVFTQSPGLNFQFCVKTSKPTWKQAWWCTLGGDEGRKIRGSRSSSAT